MILQPLVEVVIVVVAAVVVLVALIYRDNACLAYMYFKNYVHSEFCINFLAMSLT